MKLAIFDLDNTLSGGDSDYLWGEFLAEQGHVDGAIRQQQNRHYYAEYKAGRLDIHDFLNFQLQPLAGVDPEILNQRRAQYIEGKIQGVDCRSPAAGTYLINHYCNQPVYHPTDCRTVWCQ